MADRNPANLEILLYMNDSIVNRHGESLALVSVDGKPLMTKRHNAKGQLTKTDAIRSAFNRLIRKLKNDDIVIQGSLKLLRKTASSKLEAHPTYGRYVIHFLGQSPDIFPVQVCVEKFRKGKTKRDLWGCLVWRIKSCNARL